MHKSIFHAARFARRNFFTGCASHQSNLACCDPSGPAKTYFQNWPTCDPKTVGELVSSNLLNRPVYKIAGKIVYPEVCMGFGALRLPTAHDDRALKQKLIDRYAFHHHAGRQQFDLDEPAR
jgi:hypothetical protein